MIKNYLDITLFTVFLLINLILGLRASRGVKTIKDFSIGNKDFTTTALTATIVATWISGSFMTFKLAKIYSEGWYFILAIICDNFTLLFTGLFLANRMGEFLKNVSVAEALGDLYGKPARIITAICGILVSIGGVAIQFKVSAKVLGIIFDVNEMYSTIVAASIVIIYSALGGIRSVTFTDIMQFFTFGSFVPLLALVIWNGIKDHSAVIHALQVSPQFDYNNLIGSPKKLASCIALMLFYFIPGFVPPVFQRVSMANNVKQVKHSFVYSFFLCSFITFFTIWIGILILGQNSQLEPSQIFSYIIQSYTYPGLKGLILIGTMSMVMSTADSHINSAAVLFANDIAKPLKIGFSKEINTAKLFSFILGGLALSLAIYKNDFLDLVLLAWGFYMPIVTVPLLLAIFGFRSTSKAVLIGMAAGFITVLLWDNLLGYTTINSVVPGMLANILFCMGSHYILRQKGGWIGIKDPYPVLAAKQARKEAWQYFINNIRHTKIYNYLQKNLPIYEITYSIFAFYIIGATYSSFYTIPEDTVVKYKNLYEFITHSVLIITATFLTYPAWPHTVKSKRFITFAWPIGIFYILFVVGSLIVLMSGFHEIQVMIFLLNLIVAALLLAWPLMSFITTFGIIVGYLTFKIYCGNIYYYTHIADAGQFKFIYSILLVSTFLLALFRFKQEKKVLENKNIYLENLYEEKNNELAQILAYREEVLKELNEDEQALLEQTTASYLQQIIYRMTDYMRLEVTQTSLDEFLLLVKETLKLTDLVIIPQIITKVNTTQETINGDIRKIKQLLVNGVLHVQRNSLNNEPIHIILEDAKLGYKIDYIKDYIKQLPALKFIISTGKINPKKKEEIYMIEELPRISQSTKKDKLIENARIIHAHYGYGELDNEHTQVYVLPVNVREVRGKVMELLREPVEADEEELKHPLAIELEKELLYKINNTKIDNKVIGKALDTIKKYHAGVKRKSGEPFFTHPIQVALILLEYCKDQDAVIAALLHDTVEDTSLSLIQIRAIFGEKVAFIVSKVTNLEDKLRRVSLEDHENLYRLMNYEDERAAFVKLADRLHNMRTIKGHSSLTKQKHIANETLSFFVGLAEKLGLTSMAKELEKLSLEVLSKKE